MKWFVAAFLCVSAVYADRALFQRLQSQWEPFKLQHNKDYDHPSVDAVRQSIFIDNAAFVEQHNEKFRQGLVSFQLEMNQFGDMLPHEFHSTRKGLKNRPAGTGPNATIFKGLSSVFLPASVDWQKSGAITRTKDQGQCGSCYAFSAAGSLEGVYFRKTGKLIEFSEQNIVDCSGTKYNNYGCDGGFMDTSFEFMKVQGGMNKEKDYPYTGTAGRCRYNRNDPGPKVLNVGRVRPTEADMQKAVAEVGPLAVAVDASPREYMFYKTGVMNIRGCKTKSEETNHAVLLTGYGCTSDNKEFWIVKNSWGTGWGEKGYFRIARNQGNMCGIASDASYPIL